MKLEEEKTEEITSSPPARGNFTRGKGLLEPFLAQQRARVAKPSNTSRTAYGTDIGHWLWNISLFFISHGI